MEPEETVTIPKKEYDELIYDSTRLESLRQAGVDNWEGWSYSIDIFEKMQENK